MQKIAIANFDSLADRQPAHALVGEVDLVVVRYDDAVSVLYGRCLHRGALMADGHVEGDNLICGVHDWDYRLDTGVSAYNNDEALQKFTSWVERRQGLGRCRRDRRLGAARTRSPSTARPTSGIYADTGHGTAEEPHNALIQALRPRRPEEDRPPRRGRGDGRAARPAADAGTTSRS